MLRCVLFIPPGPDFTRWCQICAAYAASHGYAVVAVATTWSAALTTLFAGDAHVAVVGVRDHIPTDHTPRLEVVTEQPALEVKPMQRRPHRRDSARG